METERFAMSRHTRRKHNQSGGPFRLQLAETTLAQPLCLQTSILKLLTYSSFWKNSQTRLQDSIHSALTVLYSTLIQSSKSPTASLI